MAAIANYLKFDVYDLDIKEVQCNSDLRRLLIGTANRSILVIEDVDCNAGLQNREAGDGVPDDEKVYLLPDFYSMKCHSYPNLMKVCIPYNFLMH